MWTIHLLGALAAHSSQRSVTRFRTQKAASLLAYLAFHPAPQPRETLIELLWPDAEPDAGRHNLSNALSFLRHQLEPPGIPPGTVILADRFQVRLNPDAVTTDVSAFEVAASQVRRYGSDHPQRLSSLEQAVQLYSGPLLPGFYDEWIAPEALRMESLFVQTIGQLITELLASGQPEKALSHAQRAAAADPLSDEAAFSVMQSLDALGQPTQALRTYKAFAQRLQEDLDAQPSPAMQSLAQRLGLGGSPTPAVAPAQTDGTLPAPPLAAPPLGPSLTALQKPAPDTAPVRAAPRDRLTGGEFLLRTTTRFFGREQEMARLGKMLVTPRIRLVTLTGTGGMGKTRLALETAAQLVQGVGEQGIGEVDPENAPLWAVFVPLAQVTEAEGLFGIILRALGTVPAAGLDPLDQLAQVLDLHPNLLLVLDNFEQLAEEGALRVRELLAKAGGVKLLVTSRQKLCIEGEREFHLAPLPTSSGVLALQELLCVPSIALFVDRAQTALPDFQLTSRNAVVVAQLCDYLEGLPLAIELAAARVTLLSPKRILEQVQANRLDFLATRRRDAVSRQRTLRATLDWSYYLLPKTTQQCLRQLAVFRGGWTLEAAKAVFALSEAETLERLMLLRDSSLIGVRDTEEGVRFGLLETIREYAAEQSERTGETEAACTRHHDFFLAMAETAEPHLTGADQALWLDQLEREHDNLRAALSWSRVYSWSRVDGSGEKRSEPQRLPPPSLLFCGALHRFWSTRGHLAEGRAWCEIALGEAGSEQRSAARAKVLNGAGWLAYDQGDYSSAGAYYEQSLGIHREIRDRQGVANSLIYLGNVTYEQGDHAAARAYYEESLAIQRENGDQRGIANSLNNLGNVAYEQGNYVATRAYYEESLAIQRGIGDRRGLATSLNNLGIVACDQGDYVAARVYQEESLAIRRDIGDRRGIANSLNNLGNVAREQGDYNSAHAYHEESLAIRREIGNRKGIADSLNSLGAMACEQGDYSSARAYFEESLGIKRELGNRSGIADSLEAFFGLIAAVNAVSLPAPGEKPEVSGEIRAALRGAIRLWGAAQTLRVQIDAPLSPTDRQEWERKLARVRESLDETEWADAWDEGHGMSLEQAVAYALDEGVSAVA